MSLVQIKSDFIYGYTFDQKSGTNKFTKGIDKTDLSLTFQALFGIRLIPTSFLSLFAEGRIFQANAGFDRDINGEADTATLKGWQILAGAGYALR